MATALARSGILSGARRLGAVSTGTRMSVASVIAPLQSIRDAAAPLVPSTSSSSSIRPFSRISCGTITQSAPALSPVATSASVAPGTAAPLHPPRSPIRTFSADAREEPTQAELVESQLEYDHFDDGDFDVASLFPDDFADDDGGPLPSPRGGTSGKYSSPIGEDYSQMTNEQLADQTNLPGWDLIHCPPRKFPRGALVGKVVSDKMDKTVNVAVDRYRIVPKYRKRRKYTKKFMAHDEGEVCSMGDTVMIVPCQRISKNKHFMVREIIKAKGSL
eukprot:CAMPEP_0113556252 /NCGR_PEP_ID=MMETSP0015_2-20120614/17158_1 /TAXON_ID=2838 /ORGANISM="Odontella" /LENGTH=274 /DNA_ID=CAMNT_0000457597 /DNA_START=28 /DNA_END=852 /DNA_ORIENTATION=+ /assembly_acc=CAM_ASM_000160